MLIVRNPRSLDAFDRVFDQLTSGWVASSQRRDRTPAVHGEWRGDTLELTVDLPGVPNVHGSRDLGAFESQDAGSIDRVFVDGFDSTSRRSVSIK